MSTAIFSAVDSPLDHHLARIHLGAVWLDRGRIASLLGYDMSLVQLRLYLARDRAQIRAAPLSEGWRSHSNA